MFDQFHAHEHTSHINQTIIEKRAPTDESVRLLKEMEQAAKDKVSNAIRVADNGFECVIHRHDDLMNDLVWFGAVFR